MKTNYNNLKIKKEGLITSISLILFVIIYNFFVNYYGMGNDISNWRYYIFAIVSICSFFTFLLKNKRNLKNTEYKEINYMILTAIVFLVFSLIKCYQNGVKLPFRFFVQTSLFLLPCIYAYTLKNILKFTHIINIMKILTWIAIVFYFLESKHPISSFFNINNYLNISFFNSKSFTESHNYFDTFLQLFLFFNYFQLNVSDIKIKKSLKTYLIISLIFTLLSFKRLGVIYALLILVARKIISYDKNIKIPIWVYAVFFTLLTYIYIIFLQGKLFNLSYEQLFNLTSGRNWVLSIWAKKDYISYGYGSSMFFIGKYLEMDLPQIYLELNVICLFMFIYSFYKLTNKKLYPILIITYVMLNMLTSSSLPWSIGWIIMFLNLMCISSNEVTNINIKKEGKIYERIN